MEIVPKFKNEIKEIDDMGRWLFAVGELLGAGPDSSFGCGFFKWIRD